jgi:hypothetical protein
MEAKKLKQEEHKDIVADPGVIADEKALILLDYRPKKKVDDTINTPDKYVSRYHYETKDLSKFLELCPHCRKPSITAFRTVVVDTAIDYLADKDGLRERKVNRRRIASLIFGLIAVTAGFYYLFFHVISGFRI